MTVKRYLKRNWIAILAGLALLYFMWRGHTWALYLNVTLLCLRADLQDMLEKLRGN